MKPPTEFFKILDGRVRVFKQWSSPYWNANFHHNRVKIQTSLKVKEKAEATKKAFDWYIDSLASIKAGQPIQHRTQKIKRVFVPTDQTFKTASIKALESLHNSQRSKVYLKSLANRFTLVNELIGHTSIQDWTQQSWEQFKAELQAKKPNLSPVTLNNYKYAIQDILNEAHKRGELNSQFRFAREYAPKKDTSRTYFDPDSYEKLIIAMRKAITDAKKPKDKLRALETRDFALLMAHFGSRVGELDATRYMDIRICTAKDDQGNTREYLTRTNIKGKVTRYGSDKVCHSYWDRAPQVYRRLLKRNGLTEEQAKTDERTIWNTTTAQRSNTFKAITESAGIYRTNDREPRFRVLASCRNTYVVYALDRQTPIADISLNCLTSSAKIESNYSRYRKLDANRLNRDYSKLD